MRDVVIRAAAKADVPALAALSVTFHAEAGFALSAAVAARAFEALLDAPELGRIWLLELDGSVVGFLVLTIGFSMEYGGLRGAVDDLYVAPEARRCGVATAALAAARAAARALGARALQVEVGRDNERARRLYERCGFAAADRLPMTLDLTWAPLASARRPPGS